MNNIEIFSEPQIKKYTAIHAALTLISSVICLFFSPVCAAVCLILGILLFAEKIFFDKKKYAAIASLSSDIDRVLHGIDSVLLNSYTEGELSILSDEISKLTIRMREQNALLKQEKLKLANALADISHQLKTPLTSMNLIISILSERDLSRREQINYLRDMTELLSRTQWLIDVLLKISQLDAGVITMERKRADCAELIARAIKPLEIAAELKLVEIKTTVAAGAAFYGDIKWCAEALENILKNCIEHAPENSAVRISAAENPIYTEIVVSDSGSGISSEDLPNIFDRFYRSKINSAGYGIGLALAKQIIISNGGVIRAENSDKGGAVFRIIINKAN